MKSSLAAFALIYVSYVAFYLNRKNYSFWLTSLIEIEHLDVVAASSFGTLIELTYGASKLLAGPLADASSPKTVLCLSLFVTGIINVMMFRSETPGTNVDRALWGFNGFVHAFAWPALALIFMDAFKTSPHRGLLYSILSTSQNVGSALVPVLLGRAVSIRGWRQGALVFPGVVAMAYAVILWVGLTWTSQRSAVSDDAKSDAEEKTAGTSSALVNTLKSPKLWCLGIGYAFLQMVRVSLVDWSVLFFSQTSRSETAAKTALVWLEIGGFIGGVSAGAVSDRLFNSKRTPVMLTYLCVVALPALFVFFVRGGYGIPPHVFYFAVGVGTFGPHMLVGLLARELFPNVRLFFRRDEERGSTTHSMFVRLRRRPERSVRRWRRWGERVRECLSAIF